MDTASGTTTPLIHDISNDIMRDAGVSAVSLFYIVCDLTCDWKSPPETEKVRTTAPPSIADPAILMIGVTDPPLAG